MDVYDSLKAAALQVASDTTAGHQDSMAITPYTICVLLGIRRNGKFHRVGQLFYPYNNEFAAVLAQELAELCALSGHDPPDGIIDAFSAGVVEVGRATINGRSHQLEVICTCAGGFPQKIAYFVALRTARTYANAWERLMREVEAGGYHV